MEIEHFEKRFGMIAVEKGFVTPEQVIEAMDIQLMENIVKKKHRSLGRILVEQGFMKQSQVDEVLKSMDLPF